jgi:ribosomal protein S6
MKLNGAIRWWRSILEAEVQKLINRLQETIEANRDNLRMMIMNSQLDQKEGTVPKSVGVVGLQTMMHLALQLKFFKA